MLGSGVHLNSHYLFESGGVVMKMKWLLCSFPVLALLSVTGCSESRSAKAVAGSAPDRRVDPDLDRLQGTWRIESSTWNGVDDPEIAKTVTVLFQGDKFIVVDQDGNSKPRQFS